MSKTQKEWGSMAKTKGARTVSIHLNNQLADLIHGRAHRLGWSDSKYLRAIIERWINEGAPFLSDLDRVAEEISASKAKAEAIAHSKSEAAFERFGKDSPPQKSKK